MEPNQLERRQEWKSVLQHLRFPFSFLLLPVFLYANWTIFPLFYTAQHAWLLFFILHVLVYPSSNAFNSLQDRDEGAIGLIQRPLPVTRKLAGITMVMDVVSIALCLSINLQTSLLLALYIIASRLYSWRFVRLKKYPIIGFLTVFICQGALIFWLVQLACNLQWIETYREQGFRAFLSLSLQPMSLLHALVSSLFIGSMYPLSQIYQHEQDKKDGVQTISAWLGYRGTFLFSGFQFVLASGLMVLDLMRQEGWMGLLVYAGFQLAPVGFFLIWFYRVWRDTQYADYHHTMRMNLISAVCMNLCFLALMVNGHYGSLIWQE